MVHEDINRFDGCWCGYTACWLRKYRKTVKTLYGWSHSSRPCVHIYSMRERAYSYRWEFVFPNWLLAVWKSCKHIISIKKTSTGCELRSSLPWPASRYSGCPDELGSAPWSLLASLVIRHALVWFTVEVCLAEWYFDKTCYTQLSFHLDYSLFAAWPPLRLMVNMVA